MNNFLVTTQKFCSEHKCLQAVVAVGTFKKDGSVQFRRLQPNLVSGYCGEMIKAIENTRGIGLNTATITFPIGQLDILIF